MKENDSFEKGHQPFLHTPVLLNETITALKIMPDGFYLDGTAGGGGHSREIAKQLKTGKLICLDRDPDAVAAAKERLKEFPFITVINENFSRLDEILRAEDISGLDGILLDIGVSSHQIDSPERGFSYRTDSDLDMRMDKTGLSAFEVVNKYTKEQLQKILYEYGEERFAGSIAANIVKEREKNPIKTAFHLTEIIKKSVPARVIREKNPAKKTFQAIRIEVNNEIGNLKEGIEKGFAALNKGGRLAVITFHSLEDRTAKQMFKEFTKGCICPKDFPVCVCGRTPEGKIITKKGIIPSEEEIAENRRSRSAKLRVIEKL